MLYSQYLTCFNSVPLQWKFSDWLTDTSAELPISKSATLLNKLEPCQATVDLHTIGGAAPENIFVWKLKDWVQALHLTFFLCLCCLSSLIRFPLADSPLSSSSFEALCWDSIGVWLFTRQFSFSCIHYVIHLSPITIVDARNFLTIFGNFNLIYLWPL